MTSRAGDARFTGTTRRAILRGGLWAIGAAAVSCTRSRSGVPEPADAPTSPPVDPVVGDVSASFDSAPASADAAVEVSEATASTTVGAPRPLFQRYPQLAAALPWIDLGGLPTPVIHAEALGERLGLPGLRIKCDGQAGAEYGGSKARKLEHLLADARDRDNGRVLTFGGVGSNHALATAVHARRLGLGCELMLLAEVPSEHARRHMLAERHLGCELHAATPADTADPARAVARIGGEAPYVIPMGGTSALGNVGYVNAALELAAQCDASLLPVPDVVYVATGTTGTAAGLYVGLRAAGLPARLVAVRASNPGMGSLRHLGAEIESTVTLLRRLDPSFPSVETNAELLHLEHGFAGRGYAIPTEAGARAAALARETQGIELDSTYTSKAFSALVHDAPRLVGRSVVFWNTYDPREVPAGDRTPQDLPPALRRYFGRE